MISLQAQIIWLTSQVANMKTTLPKSVADGRITMRAANAKLNAAEAALQTLNQLKSMTDRKEPIHG